AATRYGELTEANVVKQDQQNVRRTVRCFAGRRKLCRIGVQIRCPDIATILLLRIGQNGLPPLRHLCLLRECGCITCHKEYRRTERQESRLECSCHHNAPGWALIVGRREVTATGATSRHPGHRANRNQG